MPSRPVSVCIPIYNGERFLRECLDSVVAQTYEDLEVLVVDDGSTDGSAAIVAEYATRHPQIRYERNAKNLGLVANWNRCIALARHDWIKFVFQDDLIAPTCVERLVERASEPPCLVTCRRDFVFDADVDPRAKAWYLNNQRQIDEAFADGDLDADGAKRLALEHIGRNFIGEPTSVLLHRSFIERYGPFRETLIMSCDLEYWIRVAVHTGVRYVPETLASFRVHKGATSAHNHSSRAYRTQTLDNLVIVRDFAMEPAYAPLRDYAARARPPIDVNKLLRARRNDAYARADWARRHPERPDPTLMEEFEQLSREVPGLGVHPLAHLWWRLMLRLDRVSLS